MSARYPLEALRSLRADEEELARRALAEAVSRLEVAARRTELAAREVDEHREATERTLRAEAARPVGVLRPDDAIRMRAWRERRAGALAALERGLADARRAEAEAGAAVEVARDALAAARREREAIEKHHARWIDGERRRAEAKEEAESEDRRR